MDERDVWNAIVRIIRETFDDESIDVTRETTAQDVEAWDSLSNVELMVGLEEEFGMKFHTGEIAGLKSVGELADVITARLRDARS